MYVSSLMLINAAPRQTAEMRLQIQWSVKVLAFAFISQPVFGDLIFHICIMRKQEIQNM